MQRVACNGWRAAAALPPLCLNLKRRCDPDDGRATVWSYRWDIALLHHELVNRGHAHRIRHSAPDPVGADGQRTESRRRRRREQRAPRGIEHESSSWAAGDVFSSNPDLPIAARQDVAHRWEILDRAERMAHTALRNPQRDTAQPPRVLQHEGINQTFRHRDGVVAEPPSERRVAIERDGRDDELMLVIPPPPSERLPGVPCGQRAPAIPAYG